MRSLIFAFFLLLSIGRIMADINDTFIEFENGAQLPPSLCSNSEAKASECETNFPSEGEPLNNNFGIIIDPKNTTGDILTVDNDNNNNNDNNNDFNVNNNKNTVVYYQNFNININYNLNENPINKQNTKPSTLHKLIKLMKYIP